jgi:hypothetical protein
MISYLLLKNNGKQILNMKKSSKYIFLILAVLIFISLEISLHIYANSTRRNSSSLFSSYMPYVDLLINRGSAQKPVFFKNKNINSKLENNRTIEYPSTMPEIWFFGGSTLAGDNTNRLTAEFLKTCLKNKKYYTVKNWGQSSFRINQERLLFMEALRKGKIPEIVVFYDGVNEFFKYNFSIGSHRNTISYRHLFDGITNRTIFMKVFLNRKCKTIYTLQSMLEYLLALNTNNTNNVNYFVLSEKTQIPTVADNYKFNIKLIESICKQYNIKCYFFWQPELLTKPIRSNTEKVIYQELYPYKKIRHKVFSSIKNDNFLNKKDNFLYLGDIFNNYEKHIYRDFCHIAQDSPGNIIIVEHIYNFIFKKSK